MVLSWIGQNSTDSNSDYYSMLYESISDTAMWLKMTESDSEACKVCGYIGFLSLQSLDSKCIRIYAPTFEFRIFVESY